MQTIAQQMNVKEYPFELFDKNSNVIYCENNNLGWYKSTYDENNNEIYCEHSSGYWYKKEFDEDCNEIYYENSDGYIQDNRPKVIREATMQEVLELRELAKQFDIPIIVAAQTNHKPVREVSMAEVEAKFGCVVKIKK